MYQTFNAFTNGSMDGVSDDGKTVVGQMTHGFDNSLGLPNGAVLWKITDPDVPPLYPNSNEVTGFIDYGQMLNSTSEYTAEDISGDGTVVVGGGVSGDYVWSNGSLTYPGISGGSPRISPNGKYIADTPFDFSHPFATQQGFLYDIAAQKRTDIGFLDSHSTVVAAVSNTKRVVGGSSDGTTSKAFLWTPSMTTPTDLKTYLVSQLGPSGPLNGWTLTGASDISADGRTIVGNGINPQGVQQAWIAQIPQKFVVLHFGEAAPGDFQITSTSNQIPVRVYNPSLPNRAPASITPSDQQLLIEQVQSIFDQSGVQSVTVTTDPMPDAVNVYFAVGLPQVPGLGALLGKSVSLYSNGGQPVRGINRYDAAPSGDVIVMDTAFQLRGVQGAAVTVAHEVGHALGVMHSDASGNDLMNYSYSPSVMKQFINLQTPIVEIDPTTGNEMKLAITENAVYHLRHYVDGVPDDVLAAQHVLPGTYDGPVSISVGATDYDDFASAQELYNVQLLLGDGSSDGSDAFDVIKTASAISTADVKGFLQGLPIGFSVRLLASSVSGGPYDVVLSGDSPPNAANLSIPISGETTKFWLSRIDTSPSGFTILGSGTLSAVPEPATLWLAFIAAFELCGRRKVRKRSNLAAVIYA